MRKEKALIMALKIVDTCRKYANADRCLDCPFNVHGCIVTAGNNIPTDWPSSELIKFIERQGRK